MKNNASTTLVAAALSLLLALPAAAQPSVKTLDECIEAALRHNLSVQSGHIAVERAKALQGSAFNIDRTTVSLSQDPTSGGSPDNSLSIGQRFDFPTIYLSRRRQLKAATDLERSYLDVTRNELVREISSVYYQLLYARERIKILQQQDSMYAKFVFLATAKFKAGETNRLEQMNAERLYGENKIALQQAETDYRNVQLSLQRWLNTSEWIDPADPSMTVLESAWQPADFNPRQTPVNRVFESKKAIGESALNVARQEFLPSISVALRSQWVIPGFHPYNVPRERFAGGNFMGFEAGIGIPLFFGEQRAKTRAARREIDLLKTQQEDALLLLTSDYRTALNDYAKAKNALDYYRTQGAEQADEIGRMSQLSYEKGEIGYIEYIQNLKTAAELHLQCADAVHNYNQSIITINYLQGNK
ncbi:MAG: TolC family protein [Prevotellaceae bacterium]|nr:TolC family protein [Prevotellaceae bacterium]